MWPEPLQEGGIYTYKGMTILLKEGGLWEKFVFGDRIEWVQMGEAKDYCLFIDELVSFNLKKIA